MMTTTSTTLRIRHPSSQLWMMTTTTSTTLRIRRPSSQLNHRLPSSILHSLHLSFRLRPLLPFTSQRPSPKCQGLSRSWIGSSRCETSMTTTFHSLDISTTTGLGPEPSRRPSVPFSIGMSPTRKTTMTTTIVSNGQNKYWSPVRSTS